MPNSSQRKWWIKLWTREWLDGTIRFDLSGEERSIWADLLALGGDSRNPGIIQSGEGFPFPYPYLAYRLNVPLAFLKDTLEKLKVQGRISENSDGIHIMNWSKYQAPKVDKISPEKPTPETTSNAVVENSVEKHIPYGLKPLLEILNKSENKVATLVDIFKAYHNNSPLEDFDHLGGRIAGIVKQTGNDYGFVLRVIYNASGIDIAGSHLNYIQGIIKGEKHGKDEKTHKGKLPTKYISPEEFDKQYRDQYYAEHPEFKPPAES